MTDTPLAAALVAALVTAAAVFVSGLFVGRVLGTNRWRGAADTVPPEGFPREPNGGSFFTRTGIGPGPARSVS